LYFEHLMSMALHHKVFYNKMASFLHEEILLAWFIS